MKKNLDEDDMQLGWAPIVPIFLTPSHYDYLVAAGCDMRHYRRIEQIPKEEQEWSR